MLGSVRADQGFGTDELLDLGRAMRGFSPASSEFTSVPIGQTSDYAVKGIGSTVKWDPAKAGKLFAGAPRGQAARRAHRPTQAGAAVRVDVAPRQIRVQVENGTADRRARQAGRQRRCAPPASRTTRQPTNAAERTRVQHTVIRYDPRWDRSAKSLAAALPGAELRAGPGQGPLMQVIAGADFKQVTRVRRTSRGSERSAR